MEIHSTPFPGKTQPSKLKPNRKIAEAPKPSSEEPPILKQQRVFGTNRNANISLKPTIEKPIIKSSIGISQKQPKLPRSTANPTRNPIIHSTEETEKKSPDKNRARPKKKSVCFEGKIVGTPKKVLSEGKIVGPRTPLLSISPSLNKPKIVGTPYYGAENCSKCRFDRLETSSYWLGQIKLAELVGKHFVSADFFRLAFECKAEPIRNLQVELKRYMARHGQLSAQPEWRDISLSYGLLKDESSPGMVDSGPKKVNKSENASSEDIGQQHKELMEGDIEEPKSQRN